MSMGRTGGGAPFGNLPAISPRVRGIGGNPWWGGRRGYAPYLTYWSYPAWFDTPLCASPLFPLAPTCSYGDAFGATNYPAPPSNVAPPVNVTVLPAPQPAPPPVPLTSGSGADVPPDSSPATVANGEGSKVGSRVDSQAPPPCKSAVQNEFHPMIVLTTGVYSINKYWINNKSIYFETTSGDTLYAPLTHLVRLVPAR